MRINPKDSSCCLCHVTPGEAHPCPAEPLPRVGNAAEGRPPPADTRLHLPPPARLLLPMAAGTTGQEKSIPQTVTDPGTRGTSRCCCHRPAGCGTHRGDAAGGEPLALGCGWSCEDVLHPGGNSGGWLPALDQFKGGAGDGAVPAGWIQCPALAATRSHRTWSLQACQVSHLPFPFFSPRTPILLSKLVFILNEVSFSSNKPKPWML